MNGVIDNATGDLVKAGFTDFTNDHDPATQTVRTDVPDPAYIKRQEDTDDYHRWNGSAWVLVTQVPYQTYLEKYYVQTVTGGKIQKEEWFQTDDGDGTYSDKAREVVYTYQGNKLTKRTERTFFTNGDVKVERVTDYFSNTTAVSILEIAKG